MKSTFKLAVAALCMAMGMAYSQAQTNTNTLNITLQTMNIALTGVIGTSTNSGAGNSFRVATKDVIKALGITSSSAKLQFGSAQLVSSDGTTNQSLVFLVSSGNAKNPTFTDVSDFFQIGTNSALLAKGNTGNEITLFGFGVDTNGVAFTNSALTYVVQGYTTIAASGAFNSSVNGSGTSSGNATVLKGTITATAPSKKPVSITVIR